jgi:hypothetical protein
MRPPAKNGGGSPAHSRLSLGILLTRFFPIGSLFQPQPQINRPILLLNSVL